jgi:myo-inositol-1-phosphate synthase
MLSIEAMVAVGGLFLSIVASLLGAFKYFSTELTKLRKELYEAIGKAREKLDIEHDDTVQQLTDLAQDAARRRDLDTIERRLVEMLERSERLHQEAFSRAEQLRGIAFERLNTEMHREMRELNSLMKQILNGRGTQGQLPIV